MITVYLSNLFEHSSIVEQRVSFIITESPEGLIGRGENGVSRDASPQMETSWVIGLHSIQRSEEHSDNKRTCTTHFREVLLSILNN